MPSSWSLVVATLNREDVLVRSLRANVRQARRPAQVIVVDASDGWERTRDRVMAEVAATDGSGIEWIYVRSEVRSLTYQRNRGIERCVSDVAFLLDDDSFMYSGCAETIMRIYEADPDGRIGGVSAWLAEGHEGEPSKADRKSLASGVVRAAERLWWQDMLFLPYDGHYYTRDAGDTDDPVIGVPLFHGCRMTFRTPVVRKVGGFDEMLIGTAFGEDCDFSYRVSRTHSLRLAKKAFLHHEQVPVARPRRELNTALVLLNAIALYKANGGAHPALVAYKFLLQRAALELARDCARPRKWMPYTTGILRAARFLPEVLALDETALRVEYKRIQQAIRDVG
jgi:GT2 family glycosyltransferase